MDPPIQSFSWKSPASSKDPQCSCWSSLESQGFHCGSCTSNVRRRSRGPSAARVSSSFSLVAWTAANAMNLILDRSWWSQDDNLVRQQTHKMITYETNFWYSHLWGTLFYLQLKLFCLLWVFCLQSVKMLIRSNCPLQAKSCNYKQKSSNCK